MPQVSNWLAEIDALSDRFSYITELAVLGGEPLMHSEIQLIIDHILSKDNIHTVTLVTNGLLLERNTWIRELQQKCNNLVVNISYHYDPNQPSKYRNLMMRSMAKFSGFTENKVLAHTKRIALRATQTPTELIPNVTLSVQYPQSNQDKFTWKYPKLDHYDIPVRFNNNPVTAYNECLCPYIHYIGGKLYKCSVTGTLRTILEMHNQLDEWPLLKHYKPYDLYADHDHTKFSDLFKSQDVCTYCPVGNQWRYDKTDKYSKIIHISEV